jgi:hypothetical protein
MKRTISIFLAIAFFCTSALLPAGSAESRPEPLAGLNQAKAGPAPGFREVEQEKELAKPAKRFPWFMVIGAVAGIAAGTFLIFTVFKKKDYDIRGTWEVNAYPLEMPMRTLRIECKGSRTQGNYTGDSYGAYSVEGKNVWFGYAGHGGGWSYEGAFYSRDRMSGSFTIGIVFTSPVTGTWWARKISSDSGDE